MKKSFLILFLLFGLFIGCQTSRDTFYWGNYSSTLYDLKKNPDDKTLEAHKKELLSIMDVSTKKKKQVPPGVYAEYGYMLLKEGKTTEGNEYLTKEEELYPESTTFINRIKAEFARGDK